jgi:hypothetical protein
MLAITEKQKYSIFKIQIYNGFQYDQNGFIRITSAAHGQESYFSI